MPTRTIKMEIVELDREHFAKLRELSRVMRELHNFVWRQWESWHTQQGSAERVRALIAADKAWREADKKDRGTRPKWDVKPWPNEFGKLVYHATCRRFPQVNSRVIVLAMQKIRQTVCTKNSSSKGGLKWWVAIMLDLDGRATHLRPMPIPLDKANAAILPGDKRGRVELEFRVDRIEREGKKNGASTLMRCKLKSGGKRAGYAQPAHEMAAGKRKLAGSQLFFDARKGKLFVALTYEAEARTADVDPAKVAIIRPGRNNCWLLRIDGYTRRLYGRGHHVAHKRKSLLMQRWGRQGSYRHAPPRKGRGTDRALQPLFQLSNAWNAFTRRMNDEATAGLLQMASDLGCGRILLFTGDSSRLLARAGKVEGREDSTGWPWYQFAAILNQKANRVGVDVVEKPLFGGRRATQPRPVKRVKDGRLKAAKK